MPAPRDPDDANLAPRRAALREALAKLQPNDPTPPRAGQPSADASGMSLGLRASSEFIAAIIVGALIGWGLDHVLGTSPAFSIIFFLLGVAAGVWNVIRATSPKSSISPLSKPQASAKDTPQTPRMADDDED